MEKHKIVKKHFANVILHQRNAMLNDFELDRNGNIVTEFTHKGYNCNNSEIKFDKNIMALSIFSEAGGLDIGTQLAGIKVLSSLDIFADSVRTLEMNPFFKDTKHELGDITKMDGTH